MVDKTTFAILRTTMKNLVRWNRKSFSGKPVSAKRVILRHGESGRMSKPPGILTSRVAGSSNLYASAVTPQLRSAADNRSKQHTESICNQQILAFGVRLIY